LGEEESCPRWAQKRRARKGDLTSILTKKKKKHAGESLQGAGVTSKGVKGFCGWGRLGTEMTESS